MQIKQFIIVALCLCSFLSSQAQTKTYSLNFNCKEKCGKLDKNGNPVDEDGDGFIDCEDLDCYDFYYGKGFRNNQSSSRSSECNECPVENSALVQQIVTEARREVMVGELKDIWDKLKAIIALYQRCSNAEWASYKDKGIVPECLWNYENGSPSYAFSAGAIDGIYGEVIAIIDLIQNYENTIDAIAVIGVQLVVAGNPKYYNCDSEAIQCSYEDLVNKLRTEIACTLTCEEMGSAENQLITYENIIKGCGLRSELEEAINTTYEFLQNEQEMQELGETIQAKLDELFVKIEEGDLETAYTIGQIVGIIGLNTIPLAGLTKAERVKKILQALQNLTRSQLDNLVAYIDDLVRGVIRLPEDVKYAFDGDDILIFRGDCPVGGFRSVLTSSRSACEAIARINQNGVYKIERLDEFVTYTYPNGVKILDELQLGPCVSFINDRCFSEADVIAKALKLDLSDPNVSSLISPQSNKTIQELLDEIKDSATSKERRGEIGEEITELLFARNGYRSFPTKYGANNGLDGVFIKTNPSNCQPSSAGCDIVDIILTESKSLQNGEIGLTGATTTNPEQMSAAWINKVLGDMIQKGSADVMATANAIEEYLEKNGKISKFITAPNKDTGILNVVNFGTHP